MNLSAIKLQMKANAAAILIEGLVNVAKIESTAFQTSPGYGKALPGTPNMPVMIMAHGGEIARESNTTNNNGGDVHLHFYPGAKVDSRTVSDLEGMARAGHFNKAYNLQRVLGGQS